jgi:VanZ family protein
MIKFARFHVPVILFMIVIFFLSSIPDLTPPNLGIKPQDKVYHFIFYAFFGFFIARSFFFQDSSLSLKRNFLIFSMLFGSLYGLSDEIHQYFVPGRMMSYGDFMADFLGVMAGAAFFSMRYRILAIITGSKGKQSDTRKTG